MKVLKAYEWLRERAEDVWAFIHADPDLEPPKKDPRNGL